MSKTRLALVAAAAVAAVALSACGTSTAGEAVSDRGGAETSAGVVAKPTRWISDLTSQSVPAEQRDTAGYRFGPLATGTGIWEHSDGVSTDAGCTAGPVVAPTMSPTNRGYLTAAHCDKPDRARVLTFADASHTNPQFVGVYTPRKPGSLDATSLWITDTTTVASIAGHPVAGALTEEATRAPELIGQTVCVLGAVSGLVCGKLADATAQIVVDATTHEGDSGSAMFLVSDTGAATLIGILTKSEKTGGTYGVIADTALRELGAQVVTDPVAAAAVRGDTRYVTAS